MRTPRNTPRPFARAAGVTLALGLATGAFALVPVASAQAADYDPVPHRVVDANPGVGDAHPDNMVALGSRVLYSADTATGTELWVSDGSTRGTRMLKDLRPGDGSFPSDLVRVGSRVFFTADDGAHGRELWVTDGTAAGTRLVRDISSGGDSSFPDQLVAVAGTLYFTARNPSNGRELWRSDGSFAGTSLVSDIGPGSDDAGIQALTRVGSNVVFSAAGAGGSEPWISNGNPGPGTQKLGDINPAGSSYPSNFTALGSQILFTAQSSDGNRELWRSDGTLPVLVKETVPGPTGNGQQELLVYGDKVLFNADDGTHGDELWVTDGTTSGTHLVADIDTGASDSDPEWLTLYRGTVYFAASDAQASNELWATQGTAATTRLVKQSNIGSRPDSLMVVGGTLFYSGTSELGRELWRSDGTPDGTRIAADTYPGPANGYGSPLGYLSNTLFFGAGDAAGKELWAYTVRSSTTSGRRTVATKRAAAKRRIRVAVTVRATGTTPTGVIVLREGSRTVGTATLSGGRAKVRITRKLRKGTHRLRAYYAGSVHASTSRSKVIKVVVR